jgi:hypothetical protein
MKIFSAAGPVSSGTARNCFLLNQFATPGLGSLMGRRILPGLGQLALAIAGCALVIAWYALTLMQAYELTDINASASVTSHARLGEGGAVAFLASWFWALGTSLSLLRQAKGADQASSMNVPPRITKI